MDAASIEQMNKVRVSLGMAPLPVPGDGPQFKSKDESGSGSESDELSTLDKRQAAAGSNWQKLEAEKQEKRDRQKRKDAAKKARDAQQRFAKMEGKGLGDVGEDDELDTSTWLKQQKKRQKKIEKARRMEEELAAREQQADYTSKDLAGVRVGHEMDQFDEITGEQILTLKDAEIGEDSGDDELENADIKAKEKLEERLKLKQKRPDYDPTDQEEKKAVLSKYDEEIDGKRQRRFTLDGQGNTAAAKRALDADGEVKSKGVRISLDLLKDDAPISDYVDPSMIKVKKPKKKKEKKARVKAEDEDDLFPVAQAEPVANGEDDTMDVDGVTNGATSSKKRALEIDDDEDLQGKLAEKRRQALKKRKKMDAAELARQIREEMAVDDPEADEGGITIDETSEFVANLKKPEAPEVQDRKNRTPQPASAASPDSLDGDDDIDTTMVDQSYADVDIDERQSRETSTPAPGMTSTGLEDEDNMSGHGLAASLNILRKRGLIAQSADDKLTDRERQRAKFLAEKQHLIDEFDARARQQREQERQKGTWDKMSNNEKQAYSKQQNEARERYLNQLLDEEFKKNYRPNVELRYTDEFGRSMNQKEAFKHMSHMFHGKGSGKMKTEKRLKKIEDERREQEKGLLNVGQGERGMREVQGREGRKQKLAGVRLQ
jgi:U4/U6.U5 tri-snRNP-associated protein 1